MRKDRRKMRSHKCITMCVGAVVVVGVVRTAVAAIPDCPTRYCNDSFVVVNLGTNVIDFGPTEFIPVNELYGVCNKTTCCNSAQCIIPISEGSADAGHYSTDTGYLTISLPSGFATSGSSNLTKDGELTVPVPESTEVYSIGNCSRIGLEIGAVYENILRSFDAKLICSEDEEVCEEVLFTGYESITYLVEVPGSLGMNGTPYSGGCGSESPNPCGSPQYNNCPD